MDSSLNGESFMNLQGGDVHIWFIDVKQTSVQEQILSSQEREWIKSLNFENERKCYAAAHFSIRILLGNYLNQSPQEIDFVVGPNGKPRVAGQNDGEGINFNISHSQHYVLLAITRDRFIGADLEKIRTFPEMELIVERFFSEKEKQDWQTVPNERRLEVFYSVWTRKEAYMKAHGEGLRVNMTRFSVTFLPDSQTEILDVHRGEGAGWKLIVPDAPRGYCAAVAVNNPVGLVRFFNELPPGEPVFFG
jgi:4'-phosphopantetheinyl transferase